MDASHDLRRERVQSGALARSVPRKILKKLGKKPDGVGPRSPKEYSHTAVDRGNTQPVLYVIGEFELEPAIRQLRRRESTPIHLSNRPFNVLLFLIANRDRLVTRRELIERFWAGRDVYDDSLTRCLSSVRKALGDHECPPRYVETRWAAGYRFVGPCEEHMRLAGGCPAVADRARPVRRPDSDCLAAAELYRLGLIYHEDYSRRGQRYALQMFKQALTHTPDDARVWAGIAACHVLLCLYAGGTEDDRLRAAAASERALALGPSSAEAHVACAQMAVLRDDHEAAEAAFVRAEELDPLQFFAWLGHARSCASRGDHERAVELYEKAARVKPDDYHALAIAEQSYRKLGLHSESKRAAERSAAAGERILEAQPDNVRVLSMTSSLLPQLNRSTEAQAWTEQACFLEPDEPFVNANAACVHVELYELDRALDFLERLPSTLGNRRWIEHDATLDPLRDLGRFNALMSRMP